MREHVPLHANVATVHRLEKVSYAAEFTTRKSAAVSILMARFTLQQIAHVVDLSKVNTD